MERFYTSREEAEKFAELGVKTETADLYLIGDHKFPDSIPFGMTYEIIMQVRYDIGIWPCWSASALLDMLPSTIKINDDELEFSFQMTKDGENNRYQVSYVGKVYELTQSGDDFIQALVNMISYLAKVKQIKK